MGFWHVGYFEFHEPTGEGTMREHVPAAESFDCATCDMRFTDRTEYELHLFRGHTSERPQLLFRGRQCGATRLIISVQTLESDWVLLNAEIACVNGERVPCEQVAPILVSKASEFVDVELYGGENRQHFHFEFSLAQESDLQGADEALERLIATGELSSQSIDDFLMRCKSLESAKDYYSALANYLYGVLIREESQDSNTVKQSNGDSYEGKYDSAVAVLGRFDRAPAEAICGLVAFHYNQLELAMDKTKSSRVSESSLRLKSMLLVRPFRPDSLMETLHPPLDAALSDSVLEQVLNLSSLPLCSSSSALILEALDSLPSPRPADAFKLHLMAAEIFVNIGESEQALNQAEYLRHNYISETWFESFTASITKGAGLRDKSSR